MTSDSFEECADLQKVLEITLRMGATVDTDALLRLIVDRSIELLICEHP